MQRKEQQRRGRKAKEAAAQKEKQRLEREAKEAQEDAAAEAWAAKWAAVKETEELAGGERVLPQNAASRKRAAEEEVSVSGPSKKKRVLPSETGSAVDPLLVRWPAALPCPRVVLARNDGGVDSVREAVVVDGSLGNLLE